MSRAAALLILGALPTVCAANDFPTLARVEFVLGCMNDRGGQTYDTLYPCVCLLDRIAETMSYDEFSEGLVFEQLRSTAGERGGVFRDPEQAETLTGKLQRAMEQGEGQCFVKQIRPDSRSDSSQRPAEDAAPPAPAAPSREPEPATSPAETAPADTEAP